MGNLNKKILIMLVILGCITVLWSKEVVFKYSQVDNNGPKDPWAKILADLDGDGYLDIAIGGRRGPLVWYKYPQWEKTIICLGGYNTVDGEAGDVDGDGDLDIVMGGLLWYENPLPEGNPLKAAWLEHRIADHPTHDIELADLDADGDLDIVTRDQSAFSNPRGNEIHVWRQEDIVTWTEFVISCPHGEGIVLGDIDGDSDKDIVINGIWFENPIKIGEEGNWISHPFTNWHHSASVACGDMNNDGRLDVVLTPSELKGQSFKISWFESPENPKNDPWPEHLIEEKVETVYHSLKIADMNMDGELDIITAEMHQGVDPDEVMVLLNQGKGAKWQKQVVSSKGSHLLMVGDIGLDGDMDFMGANWSGDYQPIELWENQTGTWNHLSSLTGDLPVPAVGRQVATVILDIDKNSLNDIVIPSYERMVWMQNSAAGWIRYAMENGSAGVRMEAGGDYYDIDKDGDLDVLMAAQSKTGEVWWWENPYPDYFPGKPWQRHLVISVGGTHHDQIFGDFDSDGKIELAFWYNVGKQLFLAEIPDDPKEKWPFTVIAKFNDDYPRPEGLDKIDIDLDGKLDIVGGGAWFKHTSGTNFTVNVIDPEYRFTRTAAGDLIKGGRPEVVIGSGDQTGPLNLYEWKNNQWIKKTLIQFVNHGHTLRIGDVDRDGNLDIYTAEMYRPGPLEACRQWILYGDGKGKFRTTIISTGLGTHEGRLGDLDGDGDLDILQKDFQQHRRVDIWLNPK
jgi:hypothetical protein